MVCIQHKIEPPFLQRLVLPGMEGYKAEINFCGFCQNRVVERWDEEECGMAIGPIELLVVKFPGNQFKGEIAPALKELVDSGTIQIIDLIFAMKDEEGTLAILELDALGDETLAVFEPQPSELSGSLTEDDARSLSGGLENNSSAAIMLFENTWATKFVSCSYCLIV